tara:strand:+ start:1938 stop:2126 length:189 start_codon:yes stop_codon:yes gene_type:complete
MLNPLEAVQIRNQICTRYDELVKVDLIRTARSVRKECHEIDGSHLELLGRCDAVAECAEGLE